ncbi:hypothetical protein [Evansella cellulosilytica]|uniref:Uncharacterized protein n=1 Tax=Evansella cellulosilytica (strain ATCC 21833 / DSM 2522 / FERM P-1141 / JCM 9156 / N-4) TaxID=649639 RepID=E6TWJ6_EVAC2|nr:hypothetical protein [Evansella cellulosilytica]ADU32259.1 hypothetical protein Bcell_4028 [Evansella cellulosilytica DSM 2522]
MSEHKKEKFTELDVEKLNIVDKSGKVKMTLFNQDNIPPLIMGGVDIAPGHRQNDPDSGIIFFNGKGEECGGLIYGSEEDEEGNYSATASLTFDQYNTDQVVQVHYSDENDDRLYGFSIYDRPNIPLSELVEKHKQIKQSQISDEIKEQQTKELLKGNAHRAFMGKNKDGDVSVQLMDSKGNERIRMVVDKNDVPRMEFLNEKGEVTYKLPPDE